MTEPHIVLEHNGGPWCWTLRDETGAHVNFGIALTRRTAIWGARRAWRKHIKQMMRNQQPAEIVPVYRTRKETPWTSAPNKKQS